MSGKLAGFVHVLSPDAGVVALGPDSAVPEWAVPLITNDKAWAEKPAAEPAEGPAKRGPGRPAKSDK
jgi:hypothetical protein